MRSAQESRVCFLSGVAGSKLDAVFFHSKPDRTKLNPWYGLQACSPAPLSAAWLWCVCAGWLNSASELGMSRGWSSLCCARLEGVQGGIGILKRLCSAAVFLPTTGVLAAMHACGVWLGLRLVVRGRSGSLSA